MFHGKMTDGFSYALRSFFYLHGIGELPCPGCLSQRAIPFCCDPHTETFLCPALKWRDYMPRFFRNVGLEGAFNLRSTKELRLEKVKDRSLFLLGETRIPPWDRTPLQKYCGDGGGFLICRKEREAFLVSNPLGCICEIATAEALSALYLETDAFVLTLESTPRIHPAPLRVLIREALGLANPDHGWESQDAVNTIGGGRKRIGLQYGLMRYVCARTAAAEFYHLSEVFFAALSEIRLSKSSTDFQNVLQAERLFREELRRTAENTGEDGTCGTGSC